MEYIQSMLYEKDFQISYPSINPGTEKSHITFLEGKLDLSSIYQVGNPENTVRHFFVTDVTVASLECMQDFISQFDGGVCGRDCLTVLGSGEPYKTIESVLSIITQALDADFTRKDVFVGIGGGVICDLTAFAASIFKRGAIVELVPTTLLAMVDASIGGKTGCDYQSYKNMIGTFFPASKLYYYPEFIQSLPDNQYNSGLAEAFKTALLFDKELYDIFKNESEKLNRRDREILSIVINKSVRAKASVVEKDFTEQGIRAFLNLGHTFGHALESVAGLGKITHGAAVAWGIGRAVTLSFKKEYCPKAFMDEIYDVLKLYGWDTSPVPSVICGDEAGERLVSVMHKDKKNLSGKVRIIIQKGLQNTSIEEVSDTELLSVLK